MPDKILVVDDEPDILGLVHTVLKLKEYIVVDACNGEEALQKTLAEMPDLVLLDIVMPGKSGLEVCKILKSQSRTEHIPVVLFTALGRDVDKRISAEAAADGHFTKPFSPEALVAEVKKHFDQARAGKFSKQLGVKHDKHEKCT